MSQKKRIFGIIRNGLRILCLVILVRHILPFGSYAKPIKYYDSIEDEKIKDHKGKTEKYARGEKKDIGEVENDVLEQIEFKKKLDNNKFPRHWEEEFPELEKLYQEKEELKKK